MVFDGLILIDVLVILDGLLWLCDEFGFEVGFCMVWMYRGVFVMFLFCVFVVISLELG